MRKKSVRIPLLLAHEGEVGRLMQTFDWANSPFGAPQGWSPALVTLINNILASRVPMLIAWGPQLACIYNDAYIQFLGVKHPAAFGTTYQEIWSEIWPELMPLVERGWAGMTTYAENAPFVVQRWHEYKENIWSTFSHSPIWDDGVVVGAWAVGMDTTARVLAEQRQKFQLDFVDKLRGLNKADEITAAATELLGVHLGATQVFYAEVDDLAGSFLTKATWSALPLPSLPTKGQLSDYGGEIIATLRSGMALVVDEIDRDRRTLPYAKAYADLNVRSCLVVPLVKSGHFIASLNLTRPEPYHWKWPNA